MTHCAAETPCTPSRVGCPCRIEVEQLVIEGWRPEEDD